MTALTRLVDPAGRWIYHQYVRPLKTLAAALFAITATPLALGQFSKKVPLAIPAVEGWERITGDLEVGSPRVSVQYEFYVNPARMAVYEVVRYRVTEIGPPGNDRRRHPTTEKLQWDRDGRDVRRFECLERSAAGTGCDWLEMEKGSEQYVREVQMLLQLYSAHNKAMKDRRAG